MSLDVRGLIRTNGVSMSALVSSFGFTGVASAAVTSIAVAGALKYYEHWIFERKCFNKCG